MGECKFDRAWIGNCNKPTKEGSEYCVEHDIPCCVCGEHATHECSETFQFVCGAPLCNNCTHDFSGGSGTGWFKHCRKETE